MSGTSRLKCKSSSVVCPIIITIILSLFGCGGGGGGGGSSAVTAASDPPSISNLQYTPTSADLNSGSGTVQVTGSFSFSDAGGNISSLTFTALDSSGHQIATVTDQTPEASGVKAGTYNFGFDADTTQVGSFSIQIYMTDSNGSQSNILTAAFQVIPWETKAPMPTGSYELAAGAANGQVYAVGGDYINGNGTIVQQYDPSTNTWATKSPMPTGRTLFGIGVVNNKLYALGGEGSGANLTTVEEYDPATDTWATKSPMPTARQMIGIGVVGSSIYVVGGAGNGGGPFGTVLSTLEVYDTTTDTWTTKSPMPTARYGLAVGVVNGELYAIGGNNSGSLYSTVEEYDPGTDTWTTKSPMPTARTNLELGTVNNVIYAIGGTDGTSSLSTVEAYNPASDTWSTKTSMPAVLEYFATAVVNNQIFVVGGYDWVNSNGNEAYDPTLDPQ